MMKQHILLFITLLLFTACNKKQTTEKASTIDKSDIKNEYRHSDGIIVGQPAKTALEERIFFSGKIVSKMNGVVKINAPVEGKVKEIRVQQGQNVGANELILKISGFVLFELQQQYTTSSAKIKQLKLNFERAKTLFNDNIKTESEYLLAESEYKSELANYNALKLKLQYIGLDILKIENGDYALDYSIKSPITGQIYKINVEPGEYVNPENVIAEVVNKDKVELQMSFYENDFSKIGKGQRVVFGNVSDMVFSAQAIVTRIGTHLDVNSNTIECYADISKASLTFFVINQPINGEVIISSDSAYTVPEKAVLSYGNSNYVLVVVDENEQGYKLSKEPVIIGRTNKSNVEIINFDSDKKLILEGVEDIDLSKISH